MEGDERGVVPGHFMLQLPINKVVNIDRKVVIAKLNELQNDMKARLDRPEELAIQNLLGVMSFRIREYEDALGHFSAVLSKDPDNMNALANQQFVLEDLSRMTDAQFYKAKLDGMLHLGDASSSEESKQRCRRLKARCLAELAYAHACDIHIDRVGEIRYRQANYLHEDALKLAGDLVEPSEKDNWKFCMAKNAHKIVDFLAYKEEFADAAENLKIAENLFYELTQSIPGDPEFQWESWRHLADLIRGTIHRREFKSYAFRPELKEYQENPEKCMIKATEIAPENAKLWARYANFVYSVHKQNCFQRAMQMLQRSVELDSSANNFYAFSTRAKICYKHYKFYLAESEKNSSMFPPSVKHLEKAQEDYGIALSMRESPWDFSYLGEIHHLLAKNPKYKNQGNEVVREHLEKAQVYFKKADDCQDGNSRPMLHRVQGQCLFDMGEYLGAKRCFLKAIQCEPESTQFSGYFTELLQVYLHLLQLDPQLLEDITLIEEVVDKLKDALTKYGRGNLEKHSISKLNSKYNEEIQTVAEYCRSHQEHKELVPLLTSVAQKLPFSLPVSTGGSLEQTWKAQFQQQSESQQGALPMRHHQNVPGDAITDVAAALPSRDDTELAGVAGARERSEDDNNRCGDSIP